MSKFITALAAAPLARDPASAQQFNTQPAPNSYAIAPSYGTEIQQTGEIDKAMEAALEMRLAYIETGDAATAIRRAIAAPNLDLVGIHFHLGSPIFELEPYSIAIGTVLSFASRFRDEGLDLGEAPAAAAPPATATGAAAVTLNLSLKASTNSDSSRTVMLPMVSSSSS